MLHHELENIFASGDVPERIFELRSARCNVFRALLRQDWPECFIYRLDRLKKTHQLQGGQVLAHFNWLFQPKRNRICVAVRGLACWDFTVPAR